MLGIIAEPNLIDGFGQGEPLEIAAVSGAAVRVQKDLFSLGERVDVTFAGKVSIGRSGEAKDAKDE
jgi:hypothetical protein